MNHIKACETENGYIEEQDPCENIWSFGGFSILSKIG